MKTKFTFLNSDFSTFYKKLEESNKRFANATIKLVPYTYEEAILINPDVEPRYGECLKKEDFEDTREIYIIAKDLEKDVFINGAFLQMSSNLHLDDIFDDVIFKPNEDDIKSGTYGPQYLGINICIDFDNFKNQRNMWKALTMINNEYVHLNVLVLITDTEIALFENTMDKYLPNNGILVENTEEGS